MSCAASAAQRRLSNDYSDSQEQTKTVPRTATTKARVAKRRAPVAPSKRKPGKATGAKKFLRNGGRARPQNPEWWLFILGVPRSTYYHQPLPESTENLRRMRQCDKTSFIEWLLTCTAGPREEPLDGK
jgi:hypothetical protein